MFDNATPFTQYLRILDLYNQHYQNQNGAVEETVPHCGGLVRDFRPLGVFPAHSWRNDPSMPGYIKSSLRDPENDTEWALHGPCGYHVVDFRLGGRKQVVDTEDDERLKWLHVLLVVNEGDMRADNASGHWGGAFVVHWKWAKSTRQEEEEEQHTDDSSTEYPQEDDGDVLIIDRLEPLVRIYSRGEWGEETTEVKQVKDFVWMDHPDLKLNPFDFSDYNKSGYEKGFGGGGRTPGECTTQLEQLVGMAIVNNMMFDGRGTYSLPEALKCRLRDPETMYGGQYYEDTRRALDWEGDRDDSSYLYNSADEDENEHEMSMDEYEDEQDVEMTE